MRVIMFQDRFAELVRSGEKVQTIRKTARCKPGDILSLRRWADKPYRSKHVLLRTAVCIAVQPVVIECQDVFYDPKFKPFMFMNGVRIIDQQIEQFARDDGFASAADMSKWFAEQHRCTTFVGEVIVWCVP